MKIALKSIISGSAEAGDKLFDIAYFLFRFYCGISIAIGAGLSKVFHKIDENGDKNWDNLAFGIPDWFTKMVGEIGFTFISPQFWATLAVYGEFIGGLLIAVGLFTRFSALQMAFQFFVVSFIWYEAPMPFSMYYQQLIFWGFVLIAAAGGGRFSLDHWLEGRSFSTKISKKMAAAALVLLFAAPVFSQNEAPTGQQRITFSVKNTGLSLREIDIRYFDYAQSKPIGYGYNLGAGKSHSVNLPIGTRVYEQKRGRFELVFVATAADDGQILNLKNPREITREQWIQAANDEMNEQTARLEKAAENPGLAEKSREMGLEMVTFKVSGKYFWSKKVQVRAQLPFEPTPSNNGFSKNLSRFKTLQVSYPVGTKIYVCDGDFWDGPTPEKLVFTVDSEKTNYLFRL